MKSGYIIQTTSPLPGLNNVGCINPSAGLQGIGSL